MCYNSIIFLAYKIISKSKLGDTTDDVQYIPLTLLASIAYDWEVFRTDCWYSSLRIGRRILKSCKIN